MPDMTDAQFVRMSFELTREMWRGNSLELRLAAFDARYVMHPQLVKILEVIKQRKMRRKLVRQTRGVQIIAEPGGGKSTLLRYLSEIYPPVETEDRTHIQFAFFTIPSPCTPLALANALLKSLGDPDCRGHDAVKQIDRAKLQTKNADLEILGVDNMQDLPERRGQIGVAVMGNMLRDIVDERVIVLPFGTSAAEVVINTNKQLRRRAPGKLDLCNYDITTDDGLVRCKRLVHEFEKVTPLAEESSVSEGELGYAICFGSDGNMDAIKALFVGAITACVSEGKESLTEVHFRAAFDELYPGFEKVNPFVGLDEPRQWLRLNRPNEPYYVAKFTKG